MLAFVLLTLSREIRDEVYSHLLQCGGLAIMRTSHQINQEATDILYRKAVYRMFFKCDERPQNIQLNYVAVEHIQHLSLQFQMANLTNIRHANEINTLCSDRRIMRRTCLVTLNFRVQTCAVLSRSDLDGLRSLSVFQCVVTQPVVKEGAAVTEDALLEKCWRRMTRMYFSLREQLEPALGFADERGECHLTRRLVFYPRTRSSAIPTTTPVTHEVYPF